jgi:hypothetical protein
VIYTEAELKRWWLGLSKSEQSEILDRIEEKAHSPTLRAMAENIRKQGGYYQPPPYQLQALRQWGK